MVANSWESSLILNVLVACADAYYGPEGWPLEDVASLEWALRCLSDVRFLGAVVSFVAACRDASLGWRVAVCGALGFAILTRLFLLCYS